MRKVKIRFGIFFLFLQSLFEALTVTRILRECVHRAVQSANTNKMHIFANGLRIEKGA